MHVGQAVARDMPAVAELLARSFAGDPGTLHLFPARSRHRLLVGHFRALVTERGSRVLIGRCPDSGRLEGCLLFRTGRGRGGGPPPSQVARLLAAPGALLRTALAAPALRRLERSASPAGAWTLVAMGVEPDLQGTGRGSRLLGHLLRLLDADGAACYLETVAPRNLAFYGRHGFTVAGETRPTGSVRTWAMVRPPAAAAASRRASTI